MHLASAPSEHSWKPGVTASTTNASYWLNWRFFVCAMWVFSSMIMASFLIWKYEGPDSESEEEEAEGALYADESWRPCLSHVHPAWLLAYRVMAFFVLVGLLAVNVVVDGGSIFYFYTQWTFALVTFYFGLGSMMSVFGCQQYLNEAIRDARFGAGNNRDMAPNYGKNANERGTTQNYNLNQEHTSRELAGIWGYVFQIIYQTNAGAVMLTDFVFWLIIVPFLSMEDYDLNLILVGMHSVNALFLLGDTALNSLRFRWFRISYFLLWTSTYVFFQWIIHACISIWWPYPFLDLSSPHAPIWYFVVAVMHIPCYAIFMLIIKLKHFLLLRWCPQSYRYTR